MRIEAEIEQIDENQYRLKNDSLDVWVVPGTYGNEIFVGASWMERAVKLGTADLLWGDETLEYFIVARFAEKREEILDMLGMTYEKEGDETWNY